jgi:hypothetical protein
MLADADCALLIGDPALSIADNQELRMTNDELEIEDRKPETGDR